jgi:hypothetical protein
MRQWPQGSRSRHMLDLRPALKSWGDCGRGAERSTCLGSATANWAAKLSGRQLRIRRHAAPSSRPGWNLSMSRRAGRACGLRAPAAPVGEVDLSIPKKVPLACDCGRLHRSNSFRPLPRARVCGKRERTRRTANGKVALNSVLRPLCRDLKRPRLEIIDHESARRTGVAGSATRCG